MWLDFGWMVGFWWDLVGYEFFRFFAILSVTSNKRRLVGRLEVLILFKYSLLIN